MATPVEYGAVRQIWLAALATPATKYSFLVRDDTYAKSGVVFGRTLRLGEPVNLGPNSTWRQTTWDGGREQTVWSDAAMYAKGSADTTSKTGKARLWPGFKKLFATANAPFSRFTTMRSPANIVTGNYNLLFGEHDAIGHRSGNTATLYEYVASTGAVNILRTVVGQGTIAALGGSFDAATNNWDAVTICMTSGEVHVRNNAGSWGVELAALGVGCGQNGFVNYNGNTYLLRNRQVWKRVVDIAVPSYTWSKVHDVWGAPFIRSLIVWNNRMWFIGVHPGNRTVLYVSDGTTLVEALNMEDFHAMDLKVHYGSLYIAGHTPAPVNGNGVVGQIWRYTGSSLTLLFQSGEYSTAGEEHFIMEMATEGKYLAWGRFGGASTDRRPGVMLYDAELDAIVDGPTVAMHADSLHNWTTGIISYGGEWVVSIYDTKQYSAGVVDGPLYLLRLKSEDQVRHDMSAAPSMAGYSLDAQPTNVEQYVLSSAYDGDIPGERKTWLAGRVRCKVPQNTEIVVKVLLDEGTTETTVKTITYDAAQTGYRQVVFPLKDGSGNYLKSTSIQYKLYLRNTESGNVNSTANPYVDTVEVDFMPAPTSRKQWQLRALLNNAQTRLDGTANPLTTTAAQLAQLEALWAAGTPFLYWDATADPATPVSSGTEVFMSSFNHNAYRLETGVTDENAEASFTLVEVVSS